jgi:hypothetical protein
MMEYEVCQYERGKAEIYCEAVKVQGPSLARGLSKTPEGALNKYSVSYLILCS